MTEYERRGPNDRAEIEYRASERARLSGIPHYVMSNGVESWIAGQRAKDELWGNLTPVAVFLPHGMVALEGGDDIDPHAGP